VTAVADAGVAPAGAWQTLREAPSAVKAVLAGVLVNRLGSFFQTFLVLFLTDRGLTGVQAGVALGCFGAGSLAGVLLGGTLADRVGPRLATLSSMLGSGALLLSVLYVDAFRPLLVVVTAVGVVGQLYRPAAATLLAELTPADRQVMTFALYRWALNLGTTAAPLVAAVLIAHSYDLLFWVEAATAAGFALIAVTALPRRSPRPSGADAAGRAGYREVLADKGFLVYLAALLVNAVVYIQYVATLPLMLHDHGAPTLWFSLVVALNGFVVITCELPATKVVQTWPARRAAMAGFALLGLGLSLYAGPLGLAVLLAGTALWSLAEIVGGPTMFAYPGLVAPPHLRGRYIALTQLMFSLGVAVGPVLGSYAYQLAGDPVWLCFGLASLAGLALAKAGIRPTPEESR
jgi:MFS family permease